MSVGLALLTQFIQCFAYRLSEAALILYVHSLYKHQNLCEIFRMSQRSCWRFRSDETL